MFSQNKFKGYFRFFFNADRNLYHPVPYPIMHQTKYSLKVKNFKVYRVKYESAIGQNKTRGGVKLTPPQSV